MQSSNGKPKTPIILPDIGDGYLPPTSEFVPPKTGYYGQIPSIPFSIRRTPNKEPGPQTSTSGPSSSRPESSITATGTSVAGSETPKQFGGKAGPATRPSDPLPSTTGSTSATATRGPGSVFEPSGPITPSADAGQAPGSSRRGTTNAISVSGSRDPGSETRTPGTVVSPGPGIRKPGSPSDRPKADKRPGSISASRNPESPNRIPESEPESGRPVSTSGTLGSTSVSVKPGTKSRIPSNENNVDGARRPGPGNRRPGSNIGTGTSTRPSKPILGIGRPKPDDSKRSGDQVGSGNPRAPNRRPSLSRPGSTAPGLVSEVGMPETIDKIPTSVIETGKPGSSGSETDSVPGSARPGTNIGIPGPLSGNDKAGASNIFPKATSGKPGASKNSARVTPGSGTNRRPAPVRKTTKPSGDDQSGIQPGLPGSSGGITTSDSTKRRPGFTVDSPRGGNDIPGSLSGTDQPKTNRIPGFVLQPGKPGERTPGSTSPGSTSRSPGSGTRTQSPGTSDRTPGIVQSSNKPSSTRDGGPGSVVGIGKTGSSIKTAEPAFGSRPGLTSNAGDRTSGPVQPGTASKTPLPSLEAIQSAAPKRTPEAVTESSSPEAGSRAPLPGPTAGVSGRPVTGNRSPGSFGTPDKRGPGRVPVSSRPETDRVPGRIGTDNSRAPNRVSVPAKETGKPELSTISGQRPVSLRPGTANRTPGSVAGKTETPSEVIQEAEKSKQTTRIPGLGGSSKKPGPTSKLPGSSAEIGAPGTTGSLGSVGGNNRPGLSVREPGSVSSRPTAGRRTTGSVRGTNKPGAPNTRLTSISSNPGSTSTATRVTAGPRESASGVNTPSSVSGIGKFGRPRRPGSVAVPSKSSSGRVTPGSPSNPEISGSFDKDSEAPRVVSTGGKKTESKDLPDIGDGYLPPDSEFTPPKTSYAGLPPSSGRPFNRSPSLLNKPETSTDPKYGNRPGQIVTSAQSDPKLRPNAVPTGQRIPPPSRQAGVLKRPIASKPLPEVPEKEPTGPDGRGREPPRRTTVNGKLPGSSQQKIPVPGRRRPISVGKTKQEPNTSVAKPLPQRGTGTAPQRRPSRPVSRRPSVEQGSSGDPSSSQTPEVQQSSRGSLQSVSGRPTAADRPSVRPPANVSPQRVRPGLSSRRPASGPGISVPRPVGQGPDSPSQIGSSRPNSQTSPQRQTSRPTSGTGGRPSTFQAGGVSGPLRPRPVSRRPGSGISEEPKQITSGGSSQRQQPRPINRRPSSAIGQVVATKPSSGKSPQISRPGTRQPSRTRPTGVSQPTALSSVESLRPRPVNGRPKPTGQRGETPESLPTRPLGGDGTGTAQPSGSVNEVSPQGPTSVPKSRPSFGRVPSSRPNNQTSPQRRPSSRAPVSRSGSIQTSSDPKPAAEKFSPARRPRPAYSRPASSKPADPKQTAIPESRPDQTINPVLNQPKTPGIADSSISTSPQRRPRPPYSQPITGVQTDSSQTKAGESPEKQPVAAIRPSSSGGQQKLSSKPETSPQRKRPRPAYSRPSLPRQPSFPQTIRGQSPVSQKPGSSSRRPIVSTEGQRTGDLSRRPSTTGQSESPKSETDAAVRPDVPRRRPGAAAIRRPIATGQEPGVPSRRPIATGQAGSRETEGDREEKPGAPVRRPFVTGTTGSPEIEGTRGQRPGVPGRKPVVSGQTGSPELDEGTRGQRPGVPSRRPVASGRPETSGTVGDQVQTPVSPSRRPASTEQAGSPGTGGNQGQRPGGYNPRPVATGQSPSVPSRRPARPTAVEQTGSPGTEGSVGRRPGSPSRRPSNGQRVSPVTDVEKPGVKISRFDNILPGPTIQPVLVGSTDSQNLEPTPNKQSSRPDPKVSSRNQTSVTDSKRPGATGQTFPSRPVSERPRRPLGRPDRLPSTTETGRPDKRPTATETDSTRPSVGGTPPRRRRPLGRPQPGSPGQTVSPRPTSVGQPGRRPSQTQTSRPVDRQPTDNRPVKTSRPVTTASRSSTTTPLRPPSPFSFRPRTTASKSSTTTPLRPPSPFSFRPGTVDIVPSLVFSMLPPSEEPFSGVQPGGSSGSSPGDVGSARPRDPESVGLETRAPEPLNPSVIKAQNEGFFGYLPPPP
ncbi:collagen alpha-1(VII) chain-like [Amphibalanus amphitrite]|uniref:collagen alpha-1(VII) chain-like n=1 Tax=Amphibalanus amphitrite TaxID=1232801 RepID=UPI001C902BD1|nr:collagen alpha-1(VII) chain-like [Amphibalanus amphitrite]